MHTNKVIQFYQAQNVARHMCGKQLTLNVAKCGRLGNIFTKFTVIIINQGLGRKI